MRTHQLPLSARYALGLLLLGTTSCSLSSIEEPEPMPFDESAFFTASVDGATFAANYYVQSWVGEIAGDRVAVVGLEVGSTYEGRQVTVIISGFTGPGTYVIDAESETGTWAFFVDSPDLRASASVRAQQDDFFATQKAEAGSITVASWDPASMRMVGTFSFEAVLDGTADPQETVLITDGSFSGFVHPIR